LRIKWEVTDIFMSLYFTLAHSVFAYNATALYLRNCHLVTIRGHFRVSLDTIQPKPVFSSAATSCCHAWYKD